MAHIKTFPAIVFFVLLISGACSRSRLQPSRAGTAIPPHPIFRPLPTGAPPELKQLIDGAVAQAGVTTGYDPAYVKISYPNGDVAPDTGVCSDVVVRAFRKAGIDLQKEVHEDMLVAWSAYPNKWGASSTDTNIDHRRVLNLMTYFDRKGKSVSVTSNREDYMPGDVVAWDLGNGVDHIGMVTDLWSESEKRCLIAHNIGAGTRIEDVLFNWQIKGHYRYFK